LIRKTVPLWLLAVLAAAPLAAEEMPAPRVEAAGPLGYRVTVPIGEPTVTRARAFGFDLAQIEVPGGSDAGTPGAPQLPVRTILLRIPWDATASVRAIARGARPIGALEPVPFPRMLTEGAMTRSLDPTLVADALAGPSYRTLSAGRPTDEGVLVDAIPMAAGSERLLVVRVRPVTWDPATRVASVAEEIVLDVSWDRAAESRPEGAPTRAGLAPDGAVGPRYAPRDRGAATPAARAGARAAPRLSAAPAAGGLLRVDPSRPWLRIGVVRGGLYRVTPAELSTAGFSTAGIDPTTFRLFRATPGDLPESVDVDLGPDSLRECAIAVTGEGDLAFDPADRIYFYATGNTGFRYDLVRGGNRNYGEALRSDEQSLWLTWGSGPPGFPFPGPPRRIPTRVASPATPAVPIITGVTHRVHFEENRNRAPDLFQASLRWERWFMRLLGEGNRLAFILDLPGAAPGSAADILVRMWGAGTSEGAVLPDHVVRITWNRVLADTAGWNFTTPRDIAVSGLAAGPRDTLEVEVPRLNDPTDPNRSDRSYLAWFECSYRRLLAAANDTLHFASPDSTPPGVAQFEITAITDTTNAWLLDRTDPESPIRLIGGSFAGLAAPFTLTVEDSVGLSVRRRYSLVSPVRAATPRSIARYNPLSSPHALSDLLDPANATDYLIVAPATFLAAAESLAVRRSQGIQGIAAPIVSIATTERVFAQLGAGLPDPVAIRNLLAYATRYWATAPAYVCFLGDASEDPKNYSGFNVPDLVPTYSNYFDPSLRLQFISDDWFAFLGGPGDQLFDLVIGRLPARDPLDAVAMVGGKIRTFEEATEFDFWRARSLLSADDSWKWFEEDDRDPLGNDHVDQMERKDRLHLPAPIRREKVYLNDYAFADSFKTSKPKARDAFIAAMNRGNWLVDYIGHGNESVLADEQLFRSLDLGRLQNASRPSLIAFMSCALGRFDAIQGDGLAEALLRLPTGGAAITVASSQEAFGVESTRLNDTFMDTLFPAAPRTDSVRVAGLAWALAKNAPLNVNQIVRKYAFLGDPAARPPVPRGRGVWEKAPNDSVLRGEIATIQGHALHFDGSADTLSVGTVEVEVLGPRSPRVQIAFPFGEARSTTYFLPGVTLFRGSVPLDQGSFEVKFVVPTDGRVIGRGGELRALLSTAGGRGVGLAGDSLRVGAALSPRVDQTPPDISLLYPSGIDSLMKPGDVLTIVLEDSSGIDLTRLDDPHSIFVIVDDRGTPYELTAGFRYDPGSYTRGRVDFTIPSLPPGAHQLEIHASDTYRNIGVRRFLIDVTVPSTSGNALTMDQVFNYPNPFPKETFIHARLNRPARIRVQILTVAGRRVREIQLDGKAGENYIPWDGTDSQGENVAIGVYLFKLTAEAPGTTRVTEVGRALRTK